MVTRPLELASRLRPPPRNFDFIFLVNGALIALFFTLFGSRFVLSPGLRVDGKDMDIPSLPDAVGNAMATDVVVSVKANGQIFIDEGLVGFDRLRIWLREQARKQPGAGLLIRADSSVSGETMAAIAGEARSLGFRVQWAMRDARRTGPAK